MKRRRRPTPPPLRLRLLEGVAYGDYSIPPRSVVRLEAPWGDDQGRLFRIGYYSRQDGLNCVWLVNDAGEYEQATDQRSIQNDFTVLSRSHETDSYGTNRTPLSPLTADSLQPIGPPTTLREAQSGVGLQLHDKHPAKAAPSGAEVNPGAAQTAKAGH